MLNTDQKPDINEQTKALSKKSKAALFGFALALIGSLTSGHMAMPGVILVLTGLILCIIGLRRKSFRPAAYLGVVLALYWLCTFGLLFYSGDLPTYLAIAKYRVAIPNHFWLRFDWKHLARVESRAFLPVGTYGSILFKSDPNSYSKDDIISFAQRYKWIYYGQVHLQKADFIQREKERPSLFSADPSIYRYPWVCNVINYLEAFNYIPLRYQGDCTVLAFESVNPRFVILAKNGSEVLIRDSYLATPDGPRSIPNVFREERK